MTAQALPKIVSQQEWEAARAAFMVKEKEMTRARDAWRRSAAACPWCASKRTTCSMGRTARCRCWNCSKDARSSSFITSCSRPAWSGWPTPVVQAVRCSRTTSGSSQLTHLAARDVSFTLASRAPLENLLAYKKRMSWSDAVGFFGRTTLSTTTWDWSRAEGERHQVNVFLRDGNNIYRTYSTQARGSEALGNVWGFLELTPFGRQEEWEDTPKGRPQSPPYQMVDGSARSSYRHSPVWERARRGEGRRD